MKILIAPDSFKDSLSAMEVANNLKDGLTEVLPNANYTLLPLADGGEGSLDALVSATNGEIKMMKVIDPLEREITAKYGILGDKSTAVIEMAQASGIELLNEEERNPWKATSFGTGQLIKAAIDSGVNKIILCIGGSATNDGGAGIAQALGAKLLDNKGREIPFGGGNLDKLEKIDLRNFDKRAKQIHFVVACDVNNPLCGENGASHVYGPQKGAGEEMIKIMDTNLQHYASIIKNDLHTDILTIPGGGAAGGTGAGMMAFFNATLQNGFNLISETVNLENHIKKSTLIITGEGKIDEQTQYGKVPFGVAQIAKKYNIPVIAVAGTIGNGHEILYTMGISTILSIVDKPMSLEQALSSASYLIKNTGRTLGSLLKY